MEATSNPNGADGVSDLEEMRAVSDTDFGGPPPGTDFKGFLLGNGGYSMRYDDEDDEMGDGRDGARDPHYNDNGDMKDAEDAAHAPRTQGEHKCYVGLDEGNLSGHESDLYAPSRGASPMHVDKGGSKVELDAGEVLPDEAALLQQLAAIRKAKKSKKSTPKSIAESTKVSINLQMAKLMKTHRKSKTRPLSATKSLPNVQTHLYHMWTHPKFNAPSRERKCLSLAPRGKILRVKRK